MSGRFVGLAFRSPLALRAGNRVLASRRCKQRYPAMLRLPTNCVLSHRAYQLLICQPEDAHGF
jgi:hypothetical protein